MSDPASLIERKTDRSWPGPGFPGGRRKLTLAGRTIAPIVTFLAPPRTHTGGQKRPVGLPASWSRAVVPAMDPTECVLTITRAHAVASEPQTAGLRRYVIVMTAVGIESVRLECS